MMRRATWCMTVVAGTLGSAASPQGVPPRPIPVLAWSLAELGRDKPCMVSPWRNVTMLFWLSQGNVGNVAEVKAALDQQPEGRRAIFDWDVYRPMYEHPEDKLTTAGGEAFTGPWWDHGIAHVEQVYDRFFRTYRDLGGKLDYFILDTEHTPGSEITTPERWAAVEQDPRFGEMLQEMHLESAADIYNDKPMSHTWWRYCDYLSARNYNRLYAVVSKYYPDVKCADYGVRYHPAASLVAWGQARDPGDIPGRTGEHVGTHQAPSPYGVITYLSGIVVDGKPFGLGPFRSALFATNEVREALLTNPKVPLMPWVAWRGYVSDWEKEPPGKRPPYSSIGNTDYWQEVVFHTALCAPDTLCTWNPYRWQEAQDPADYCQDEDMQLLDDLMDQINGLVGYSDRTTLVEAVTPAHQPFILTGCRADGRTVWRLTPDPEQSAVELSEIRVKDDPLTFRLGSQTLTMPGARLFTPEKQLSAAGHWIVGPAQLRPVFEVQ
ncbi:MAG: hypothetical protein FJX75_06155 [Armatimonadetes bacterium]|nr:hypothetical protein [Armatimonadota bacterium]